MIYTTVASTRLSITVYEMELFKNTKTIFLYAGLPCISIGATQWDIGQWTWQPFRCPGGSELNSDLTDYSQKFTEDWHCSQNKKDIYENHTVVHSAPLNNKNNDQLD